MTIRSTRNDSFPNLPTFLLLFMTVGFFFFCGCKAPWVQEDRGEIEGGEEPLAPLARLTAGLFPGGREIPGPLALGDFLLAGKPCDLGQEVKAALPASLKQFRPDLEVISHDNLQAVLKTQELQMKDLFLESPTGPGRLLPARTLLVGFLFPGDMEGTALDAQIIDLDTGRILSAARTLFPDRRARVLDPYGELPLEVEFWVTARLRSVEGEFFLKEGEKLCSGDMVTLRLKPNRPAYLYVFLLDSQGEANLLFPKSPDAPARIEGGELFLPSSREGYRLDDHPGEESLLVAAALSPIAGMEDLLRRLHKEAAKAVHVLDAIEKMGRRGFVGTSRPKERGEGEGMAEVMRGYTGVVWRRFAFQHLP